jgi:hypothetical protein
VIVHWAVSRLLDIVQVPRDSVPHTREKTTGAASSDDGRRCWESWAATIKHCNRVQPVS